MSELKDLINEWNRRQTCNNQPEQNNISKAKTHGYGICANGLSGHITKYEQAIREDERRRCAERVKASLLTHGYIDEDGGYEMLYLSDTVNAIMAGGE